MSVTVPPTNVLIFKNIAFTLYYDLYFTWSLPYHSFRCIMFISCYCIFLILSTFNNIDRILFCLYSLIQDPTLHLMSVISTDPVCQQPVLVILLSHFTFSFQAVGVRQGLVLATHISRGFWTVVDSTYDVLLRFVY